MARKRKFDYFNAFLDISNYAVEYADKLVGFLEEHYDEETESGEIKSAEVLSKLTELHEIEDSSDSVTHAIAENLVTEFVAPIDREDVMELADELDTVVDELDDVLQRMYMYNVTTITPEIIEMVHVVHKATVALQLACEKFTSLKKTKSIRKYIVEINDCEDEGDQIYIKSVHSIYKRTEEGVFDHPLVAVGLVGVLSSLEKCCDACESVGDTIVMVRLKNS